MNNPIRRHAGFICLVTLVVMQGFNVHVDAVGAPDGTQDALALVRSSVARVQGIVGFQASRDLESERVELRRVAEALFDFEAMSRRVLARHWTAGSPQQQAEFVRLLTDRIERIWIDVIISGAGASTTFDGASLDGSYARVTCRVASDRGPDISIGYRLSRSGERWAVYDVLHEGTSLVSNYRGQVNSIFRTSSFLQLLERMRRNESQAVDAEQRSEDLVKRLMLLSAIADRGRGIMMPVQR